MYKYKAKLVLGEDEFFKLHTKSSGTKLGARTRDAEYVPEPN